MPTTAASRVGELRLKQEASRAATIADAATYWADAPKTFRAWDVDVAQLKYASEDDQTLQVRAFADPCKILTVKQGTLPFKLYLHGLNQTAAAGTGVTQDNLGWLLQCAFGGVHRGTTRAVGAGSSTTTTVLVADTSNLVVGSAVMINSEARLIITVNANTSIVLNMALSAAPTEGDLIKAAESIYIDQTALTDVDGSGHNTICGLFRGLHSEDQYQIRGAYPQIELMDLGSGKVPRIQGTLHPMTWELVSGVAIGTIPTEAAPAVQKAGGFFRQTVSTTTRNSLAVKSVDIKLGLVPEGIASPAGANGVDGHVVLGGRSTIEVEYLFDSDRNIAYEAKTNEYIMYQLGTGVMIAAPSAYLDDTPERTADGPTGAKCVYHLDEGSDTTNDLTRSRFSIHRFAA